MVQYSSINHWILLAFNILCTQFSLNKDMISLFIIAEGLKLWVHVFITLHPVFVRTVIQSKVTEK